MNLDEALRLRIRELVSACGTTLTALCLNANLTPSTVFDFMSGKSKCPTVFTIKKLCASANITLSQFFDRDYFNNIDEVYE